MPTIASKRLSHSKQYNYRQGHEFETGLWGAWEVLEGWGMNRYNQDVLHLYMEFSKAYFLFVYSKKPKLQWSYQLPWKHSRIHGFVEVIIPKRKKGQHLSKNTETCLKLTNQMDTITVQYIHNMHLGWFFPSSWLQAIYQEETKVIFRRGS